MTTPLNDLALDRIFRTARTYRRSADAWLDTPVSDDLLRQAYDLAKFGPTSANCQPLRVVFVRSPAAKEKLRSALSASNVEQSMAAPATAIIAADHAFYRHLPRLYTEENAVPWFEGKPDANGIPQLQPAGCLPDHRAACAGTGLRSHVGVQQCQGG